MNTTFPIAPEHFWAVFSQTLRSEWQDSSKRVSQYYNDAISWTPYVTALMQNLSERFSCVAKTEFWPRIDVCYFAAHSEDWAEWALEAAIELENKLDWHNELCKLLMVNAGLKVLIAYDDSHQNIHDTLTRFTSIYQSRKYYTSPCSWLFIFGPRLVPAVRDFVAFTFDGTTIREITAKNATIL